MTFDEATKLSHGNTIYHKILRNADKTALRARVTGKTKLWKTRPTEFQIPIKHGLYDCSYLDQLNMDQFSLTDPTEK